LKKCFGIHLAVFIPLHRSNQTVNEAVNQENLRLVDRQKPFTSAIHPRKNTPARSSGFLGKAIEMPIMPMKNKKREKKSEKRDNR